MLSFFGARIIFSVDPSSFFPKPCPSVQPIFFNILKPNFSVSNIQSKFKLLMRQIPSCHALFCGSTEILCFLFIPLSPMALPKRWTSNPGQNVFYYWEKRLVLEWENGWGFVFWFCSSSSASYREESWSLVLRRNWRTSFNSIWLAQFNLIGVPSILVKPIWILAALCSLKFWIKTLIISLSLISSDALYERERRLNQTKHYFTILIWSLPFLCNEMELVGNLLSLWFLLVEWSLRILPSSREEVQFYTF